MGFRLCLPRRFYEAMVAQALAELPNECCGLLGGTIVDGVARVQARYPLVNEAASPVEYLSEGLSLFWADKTMRWRHQKMLAIYHSHPTSAPIPSGKDRANYYSDEVVHLIISLAAKEPEVRGWWLTPEKHEPAEWSCTEEPPMTNAFLLSERLYLRPLERDDAATIAGWLNDPEVNNTLLFQHPLAVAAEQEYIDEVNRNREQITLGIVVREDNRFIGVIGLKEKSERDRHATFGIAIGDKAQWKKGYGTEATVLLVTHAFQTMNLNRVQLYVLAENTRAVRSYVTAGFKEEGKLRQHQYRDGRYQDVLLMAALREEWKAKK